MYRVLFVDDEKNILKAIKRTFLNEPFKLYFADNGEKGLNILKKKDIHIVVVDMYMPGMKGDEFIKAASKIKPECIKLVLSGKGDLHNILSAIAAGEIKDYILKPWDSNDLVEKIKGATLLIDKKEEK